LKLNLLPRLPTVRAAKGLINAIPTLPESHIPEDEFLAATALNPPLSYFGSAVWTAPTYTVLLDAYQARTHVNVRPNHILNRRWNADPLCDRRDIDVTPFSSPRQLGH
jgi:hypothetical protein